MILKIIGYLTISLIFLRPNLSFANSISHYVMRTCTEVQCVELVADRVSSSVLPGVNVFENARLTYWTQADGNLKLVETLFSPRAVYYVSFNNLVLENERAERMFSLPSKLIIANF